MESAGSVRLNKYLASCALGSRRHVEELVRQGRVEVDGNRALSPGERVGPGGRVCVDGRVVVPRDPCYVVCYKPRGVVCAVWDRFYPTVLAVLPPNLQDRGLFPVGRLDKDSEGLLILTNDGDFAQSVAHPRFGVTKKYRAELSRPMDAKDLGRWRRGVDLEGRWVVPERVDRFSGGVEVILREGMKREIRMMARALGYEVTRLTRVAIGALKWEKLPPGGWVTFPREELWCMIRAGGLV